MHLDQTTYADISVFHQEEEFSIFHKLNFTRTVYGKNWLKRFFSEPHHDLKKILGTQTIIRTLGEHLNDWPVEISNGTLLVIEKYLDYNLDPIPQNPNSINSWWYKTFNVEDYRMVKYSLGHAIDFFKGINKLTSLFSQSDLPSYFKFDIERAEQLLKEPPLAKLASVRSGELFTPAQNLYFGYHLHTRYKNETLELIDIFGKLDAWYSMATAMKTYELKFPEFIDQVQPLIQTKGLYHLLIKRPIAYEIELNPEHNFLFLTGANMAGKSTLIKAVGSAVFLAHLGMGVPAQQMKLTVFDGLLTNINVVDNIAKGESYFYNEVQRVKNTVQKINNGQKWLVLIDELFKGTNVQDAMKCSITVIQGLIKIKKSLFILSTHLYEIGEELKQYPNISFRYFETSSNNDQLVFSYQLKEGISNDRLGYLILKRERVVDLLEKL